MMEWLEAVKEFGTPSFIFDERILGERIKYLRQMLPESVGLCYAVKANAFIIPYVAGLVERLEVCSPGEYDICKKYGISTSQMVMSGVNKTEEYVRRVVQDDLRENGVCRAVYTVESSRQAQILEAAAEQAGTALRVLLRFSSGNQFGMGAEELTGIVETRKTRYRHLSIQGIQYFSGTQRRSIRNTVRELAGICRLMDDLELRAGLKCEELEYGTGFPVCYFQGEAFDEEAFLNEFSERILSAAA